MNIIFKVILNVIIALTALAILRITSSMAIKEYTTKKNYTPITLWLIDIADIALCTTIAILIYESL